MNIRYPKLLQTNKIMTKIENIILYTISTILFTIVFINGCSVGAYRYISDFLYGLSIFFFIIYLPEIIIILINFILQKLKVENKIILITIKLLIYIFSILLLGFFIYIFISFVFADMQA